MATYAVEEVESSWTSVLASARSAAVLARKAREAAQRPIAAQINAGKPPPINMDSIREAAAPSDYAQLVQRDDMYEPAPRGRPAARIETFPAGAQEAAIEENDGPASPWRWAFKALEQRNHELISMNAQLAAKVSELEELTKEVLANRIERVAAAPEHRRFRVADHADFDGDVVDAGPPPERVSNTGGYVARVTAPPSLRSSTCVLRRAFKFFLESLEMNRQGSRRCWVK